MRILGTVQDWQDNVIGFRCNKCGGVFQSMWGNTCNGCRDAERRHKEILEAINHNQMKSNHKS